MDLLERAGETLRIMHSWGYAPRIEALAKQLLGGSESPELLNRELENHSDLVLRDGFVALREFTDLIPQSRTHFEADGTFRREALALAGAFAKDLAISCPMVECIALSGSLASGGYTPQDDIDFDLVVEPGTKYLCYLVAQLIGLKFSWRNRGRRLDEVHHTPLFPKVTCVNVVWTDNETEPFVRRDENMAFELMRCEPLHGARLFRSVLEHNSWLRDYFPQIFYREWPDDSKRQPNFVGRALAWVGRNQRMLRWVEARSRKISWLMYRYVQRSRRDNPHAVARMEFLRKVKFPYEVFQD